MGGIFDISSKISPLVMTSLFVDDWDFIASNSYVKEIIKSFEKVVQEIIEWEKDNAIPYNK